MVLAYFGLFLSLHGFQFDVLARSRIFLEDPGGRFGGLFTPLVPSSGGLLVLLGRSEEMGRAHCILMVYHAAFCFGPSSSATVRY
jgi:hypothetical protein